MTDWQGQTVLITGATSGLGAATAKRFLREGATVIVTAKQISKTKSFARTHGGRPLKLDVAQEGDWSEAVASLKSRNETLHVLINNAGVARAEPLMSHDTQVWSDMIAVNQTGVFFGLKHVGGLMAEQRMGSIINIASIATKDCAAGSIAYTASKCAVIGMTKVAAKELGPKGVRVNALSPGMIDTPMADGLDPDGSGRRERSLTIPLQRTAHVDEIAKSILYLAGRDASYSTGSVLTVDGGAAC